MLLSPAIVVPFCKGINGRASTFWKKGKNGGFSRYFRVFSVPQRVEATIVQREKNLLLLRICYAIWKKCLDFMNLLGMTKLVAGDQLEPGIEIEHAEKRVRPAIGREISRFCFVEERESSFSNSAEGGEHRIFFGEERGVDRKRGSEAADAVLGEEKREAKALGEWNGARRVTKDAVGVGDDAGFDLAEVGDDFGGGPGGFGGASLPEIRRDSVGGS
jgi:hypothetical protein